MTIIRTWHLNVENIAAAKTRLAKINARAAKQGLEGRYTYSIGETVERPVFDTSSACANLNGQPAMLVQGCPVPCPVIGIEIVAEFTVEGDAPAFGGWKFCARITNDEGAVVLRIVPGFDGEIDRDSIRPGECDHCQQSRNRKDTYLVENAESGEMLQVGSACVKDFLGHAFNARGYDLDGMSLDEIENGFESASNAWTTETILARAIGIIRVYGFVSRRFVEQNPHNAPKTTAETLKDFLAQRLQSDDQMAEALPRPYEIKLAAKVREWVFSSTDSGDYMTNLREVLRSDTVSERNFGLLVSAPAAYDRHLGHVAERQTSQSQWVGELKQKIDITVTVVTAKSFHGNYGTGWIYVFVDGAGNQYKWFASRCMDWQADEALTLVATIKDHDEFRGIKATVLTRCKQI